MIENIISDIETLLQDVNTEMNLVYEALEQLREIMALENNGTTSRLVDFFRFCSDAKTFVGSSGTYSKSTLSEITLLPSTKPSTILSPSGESFATSSVSSGTLIGLSVEATSTSSTIVMDLDSSTRSSSFTESELSHSLARMIPSPTIPNEATSSIEYYSLNIDVDDVVVTPSVDLSQEEEKDRFPWLNVRHLEECHVANRKFKTYFNNIILASYGHIKRDQEFLNFRDVNYVTYKYRWPDECSALIDEGKKSLNYFWTVLDLINNVIQGDFVDMKNLTSAVKIFEFVKTVDDFDARLQKTCGLWKSIVDKSKTQIGMALKMLSEAKNTISKMASHTGEYSGDTSFSHRKHRTVPRERHQQTRTRKAVPFHSKCD